LATHPPKIKPELVADGPSRYGAGTSSATRRHNDHVKIKEAYGLQKAATEDTMSKSGVVGGRWAVRRLIALRIAEAASEDFIRESME